MQKLSHQVLSFDAFALDLTRGCLLCGAEEIKLRPKAFEVLSYLVENNGRLVSKNELIKAVWPDSFVTDDSLVQCLIEVRRALGDEAQQIIKTVPRRGYIFDKEVTDNSTAQVTTYREETAGVQVIIEEEETNGQRSLETPHWPASHSVGLIAAPRATRIERLTTTIKQHKWSAALGVLTLAMVATAIVYFTRTGEAIDSVAVMPFVNVSADPKMEYLSDGLSDSIINSLSQLPSLKKVIALNSVLHYKGKQMDPQVVGRELSVRAVLMGRLIQQGDGLSISAELVDVRDNRRLWGQQYSRKLADITAVQAEIAQEISEKLRLRLTGDEKKRLTKRYTENGEAYQLYVTGRYYAHTRSGKGSQKSIELFEQAIKRDPNYAPAYAGLALTYSVLGYAGLLPPKEARQKEEWAALKAMEIDDTLAEAHVAMAHLRALDLNWSASEEECRRALELNPNSAEVQGSYGHQLIVLGRLGEGMLHLKRAQELDPLSLELGADIGRALYISRQYDRAIEQFQKTIEMDPNFAPAHTRLGLAYLAKGMYEEAIAEYEKAKAIDERSRRAANLGYAYGVAGKKDEALKVLDELKERAKQADVSPYDFALIYMGLGDKDQAFVWLEKTYEERPDILEYIKLDPKFDSLRSDPRFTDLLRRMKLAP
jgi:TolB-like protein/DNA-binding winged helix-turn-helix (wHTH) protein/Tfp pilus assembly protein PilF